MAKDSSFDIVSEFDFQELVNAVDQAKREIDNRYDLKEKGNDIEMNGQDSLSLVSPDEYSLSSVNEILAVKVSKRGLSPLILDPQKVEDSLGGKVKQVVKLKKGLDTETAKKIVAEIKSTKLKVQSSIQGEQVRVSGKNKDDLQEVISLVREKGEQWGLPLQFTNYR